MSSEQSRDDLVPESGHAHVHEEATESDQHELAPGEPVDPPAEPAESGEAPKQPWPTEQYGPEWRMWPPSPKMQIVLIAVAFGILNCILIGIWAVVMVNNN